MQTGLFRANWTSAKPFLLTHIENNVSGSWWKTRLNTIKDETSGWRLFILSQTPQYLPLSLRCIRQPSIRHRIIENFFSPCYNNILNNYSPCSKRWINFPFWFCPIKTLEPLLSHGFVKSSDLKMTLFLTRRCFRTDRENPEHIAGWKYYVFPMIVCFWESSKPLVFEKKYQVEKIADRAF